MLKRLLLGVLVAACVTAAAMGGSISLMGAGKAPGGGVTPATYTPVYGDAQDIAFASSTYTSPSQTWPAGVAVVFVVQAGSAGTLSVTINGVSATQIGSYSTGQVGSLWRATVTSGSGTVVVVGSAVFGGVATAGGVVTTSTPTPASSQVADMAVAAEPQAVVSTTVPSDGVGLVFAGAAFGSAASLPLTWASGGVRDAITESAGSGGGSANAVAGGAHVAAGTSATPTVSTANGTFNFAGSSGAMAAVAFSP